MDKNEAYLSGKFATEFTAIIINWAISRIATIDGLQRLFPDVKMYAVATAGGPAAPAAEVIVVAEDIAEVKVAAEEIALGIQFASSGLNAANSAKRDLGKLKELTKTKIISRIDADPGLIRAAEEMGKDPRVQQEANHLIDQLLNGNTNPGTGGKNLFKDINYLRGRNGARVFYRYTSEGIEILGKSNKANEQKVINILKRLYE